MIKETAMHEVANNRRRITLRVSPQLHQMLLQAAKNQNKPLNHLTVEALEQYLLREQERLPLKDLSPLLVPAAQAPRINEETLIATLKKPGGASSKNIISR